mmetsp:Transcript_18680/g.52224  ORF Transcript_18680/g.52224 Transcript_18680/m.52224 type:complete len:247 (-) Transcript_18680:1336-2076(-)
METAPPEVTLYGFLLDPTVGDLSPICIHDSLCNFFLASDFLHVIRVGDKTISIRNLVDSHFVQRLVHLVLFGFFRLFGSDSTCRTNRSIFIFGNASFSARSRWYRAFVSQKPPLHRRDGVDLSGRSEGVVVNRQKGGILAIAIAIAAVKGLEFSETVFGLGLLQSGRQNLPVLMVASIHGPGYGRVDGCVIYGTLESVAGISQHRHKFGARILFDKGGNNRQEMTLEQDCRVFVFIGTSTSTSTLV